MEYAHKVINCSVGQLYHSLSRERLSEYSSNNLGRILDRINDLMRNASFSGKFDTRIFISDKDIVLLEDITCELKAEGIDVTKIERWRHFNTDMATVYISWEKAFK
jgi:hypothetical protein